MKMRHGASVYKGVHMFGAKDRLLDASTPVHQDPDGARLIVSEVTKARNVPFGLHHQVTAVGDLMIHRVEVADVDQVILIDDSALCFLTLLVLLADEAAIVVRSHADSLSQVGTGDTPG
jgi:hypothetical protein